MYKHYEKAFIYVTLVAARTIMKHHTHNSSRKTAFIYRATLSGPLAVQRPHTHRSMTPSSCHPVAQPGTARKASKS